MAKVKINFENNLPMTVPFGTIAEGSMFVFTGNPDSLCIKGFNEDYFVLGTESYHVEKNLDAPVYFVGNVEITYSIAG